MQTLLLFQRVVVRLVRYSFGLCLILSGCTAESPVTTQQSTTTSKFVDYRTLSFRLKQGMSEQNVLELLGQPTSSKLTTCGQALGHPWPCKMLVYGSDASSSLVILLQSPESADRWVVSSWYA